MAMSYQKQKGLALIVMVFIFAILTTATLMSFVNADNLRIEQKSISASSLAVGKEGLIGRSVMNDERPGSFPCPDTNGDGSAELLSGNNCPSYIGLLPWKTLGLAKPTDGVGQLLWYVLSPNFRDDDSAEPINSNNNGQLELDGKNNIIALIIAPGAAINDQIRSATTNYSLVISNYLDESNNDGDMTYISNGNRESFNDQVIAITPSDVFPLVERRVLDTVRDNLATYYTNYWQVYPYAATWGANDFIGVAANRQGQLALNTVISWNTAATTVSASPIAGGNCIIAANKLQCTINYVALTQFTVNATINNLGSGFFNKLTPSDITISAGGFTVTLPNQQLNQDGTGTVIINGTRSSALLLNTLTVTINLPATPAEWQIANSWLWKNDWQNLIYYSAALPFSPGGDDTCSNPSDCLAINTLKNATTTTQSNVAAVVMIAGTRLDATELRPAPTYNETTPAQTRPSADLADYFDRPNNTMPSNLIFDTRARVTSTFNDQVLPVTAP